MASLTNRMRAAHTDPPTKTVTIEKNAPLAEQIQKAALTVKTVYRCGGRKRDFGDSGLAH
jgi:hypothetical protein